MTHVEIKPTRIKPAIVDLVVGSLQIGQVVVLPTDTIYGLSCLADKTRSIKKIYHLKKRDPKKPILILVRDLAMAKRYVFISKKQEKLLKMYWSKTAIPTTVILKNRHNLPKELTRGVEGLAVRLPKSKFLIKILEKVDCPIISTSLNLSGKKDIIDLHRLHVYFPKKNNRPDLIIDAGPSPKQKPSRLVNLLNEDKPIVIRK